MDESSTRVDIIELLSLESPSENDAKAFEVPNTLLLESSISLDDFVKKMGGVKSGLITRNFMKHATDDDLKQACSIIMQWAETTKGIKPSSVQMIEESSCIKDYGNGFTSKVKGINPILCLSVPRENIYHPSIIGGKPSLKPRSKSGEIRAWLRAAGMTVRFDYDEEKVLDDTWTSFPCSEMVCGKKYDSIFKNHHIRLELPRRF